MERGDVYLLQVQLPDRTAGTGTKARTKYVVALQGGKDFETATDLAIVLCSTNRKAGRALRPFEVPVGPSEGFDTDTLIDCRWVYTIPKPKAPLSAYQFRLPADVMNEVSTALVVGLQM